MSKEQDRIFSLLHKLPSKELCELIGIIGNIISDRMRIQEGLKEMYFAAQTMYRKDEEMPYE